MFLQNFEICIGNAGHPASFTTPGPGVRWQKVYSRHVVMKIFVIYMAMQVEQVN